jgi:hypothetical protein
MTFCRNINCEYNSDTKRKKQELGLGTAGHCEKSDIMMDSDGCCMSRSEKKRGEYETYDNIRE